MLHPRFTLVSDSASESRRKVARLALIGEVRTSLVQNSAAVGDDVVMGMLDLLPGHDIHRIARPVQYAASPEQYVGVDCSLALRSRSVRAVGTVGHRTVVTGGHIIQGSVAAEVRPSTCVRRPTWSYYLASPGRLEMIGRGGPDEAAQTFLGAGCDRPSMLDLGSVADRAIDSPQSEFAGLDLLPPLQALRGRLRWSAIVHGSSPSVRVNMEDGAVRTVFLRLPPDADLAGARAFCEDLALHDWLLTTVDHLVRGSGIGRRPSKEVVEHLRPAVDHLLHLWSPGARPTPLGVQLWQALDVAMRLDRQWQTLTHRIRDQLALTMWTPAGR